MTNLEKWALGFAGGLGAIGIMKVAYWNKLPAGRKARVGDVVLVKPGTLGEQIMGGTLKALLDLNNGIGIPMRIVERGAGGNSYYATVANIPDTTKYLIQSTDIVS